MTRRRIVRARSQLLHDACDGAGGSHAASSARRLLLAAKGEQHQATGARGEADEAQQTTDGREEMAESQRMAVAWEETGRTTAELKQVATECEQTTEVDDVAAVAAVVAQSVVASVGMHRAPRQQPSTESAPAPHDAGQWLRPVASSALQLLPGCDSASVSPPLAAPAPTAAAMRRVCARRVNALRRG